VRVFTAKAQRTRRLLRVWLWSGRRVQSKYPFISNVI